MMATVNMKAYFKMDAPCLNLKMTLRTPTTFQTSTNRVVGVRCYLDKYHPKIQSQHQQRRKYDLLRQNKYSALRLLHFAVSLT